MCENEDVNNKTTLIHVQADGENDTLHYIWDLTRQPTILVALCEKNTNVTIDWDKTLKDAGTVNFTSKPKYTMSFVLTKVSCPFNFSCLLWQVIEIITYFINYFDMKGVHVQRYQESSINYWGEWFFD